MKFNCLLFVNTLLASLVVFSCNQYEKKYEYFDDGKPKKVVELKNNVKDGVEIEYFRNSQVFKSTSWENGKKNGPFRQFFPNGNLGVLINYSNDLRVGEMKLFYETGEIFEIQYYDKSGRLIDVKEFDKMGHRTKELFPLVWIENDTLQIGDTVNVILSVGNISDFELVKGTALRVSDFDSINGKYIAKDTLDIIQSSVNYYNFKFRASKKGGNFFRGQIFVDFNVDTLAVFSFEQSYFVK